MSQWKAAVVAALTLTAVVGPSSAGAQAGAQTENNDDMVRRAKVKVWPTYPELAHRMNIAETVKVEVVVATNGTVKQARIVGGHPVLATAALDAAKKWKFEPAAAESTGVIDFKFQAR